MMTMPLTICAMTIDRADCPGRSLDMTGRCAFVVCTEGDLEIKILNERYSVTDGCMFACMPFVNIEVMGVRRRSQVIVGYVSIEDVPRMINRWANTDTLTAIQNQPLVSISDAQFARLMSSIGEYQACCDEMRRDAPDTINNRLQQDIFDFQGRLIVAQVLKIYLDNMSMAISGHTHRDVVFQRFMLALYAGFREHRDVAYYAMRSGVSPKYFSTSVRRLSGKSPSEWIETVVVGEAKSMLNDVNRSIKDIATVLNFPDAPTFTKYFRRIAGISPKAYRRGGLD